LKNTKNISDLFFIFVHIEKAAGTTFNHILRNNLILYVTLNNTLFWTEKYDGIFNACMLQKLLKYFKIINGVGGHTIKGNIDYQKATKKSVTYLTFLRNPIDRYLSHYSFQKNVMNINWTIDKFIENKKFNNFQTKKIAGSENLDLAKKIISERFNFVGLTEQFDVSLKLLKIKFPRHFKDINYERKNVLSRRVHLEKLPNVAIKKIRNNNLLDIELYKYAYHEIFLPEIKRYEPKIKKDLFINKQKFSFLPEKVGTIKKYFFDKIVVPVIF
jgi:hypothetical protein